MGVFLPGSAISVRVSYGEMSYWISSVWYLGSSLSNFFLSLIWKPRVCVCMIWFDCGWLDNSVLGNNTFTSLTYSTYTDYHNQQHPLSQLNFISYFGELRAGHPLLIFLIFLLPSVHENPFLNNNSTLCQTITLNIFKL
jgi:hypothetical protein